MTGKYEHSIDAKGRLFVPAKLREELGTRFHVAIGANREADGTTSRYLVFYPQRAWEQLEEKLNALPSSQSARADFILAYAALCEPDAQGRILLDAELRRYAGLEKNVVITGSGNRAKVWDRDAWERRCAPHLDPASVADTFAMLGL